MVKIFSAPAAAVLLGLIFATPAIAERTPQLTLMDAVRKMSLMPAQRLEKATLAAHAKGRLQEGADADVTAFDLATVSDRSTYQQPMEPSIGMKLVIVNGTVLIAGGKMLPGTFPGRALTRDSRE
jgi:N-acyl-D-glutamate deacylase